MIAAIYACKSTEQNVSDDAKSVTRQVELARVLATEKGWQVIEEYVDDGISGAESTKLVSRARMLAAASEGKFSVLIIRDLDRLSRNDEELPSLVYSLRECGVEIWCYADRTRVDTRTALHRGMLSMKATFAAVEREAAQARTREALRRKAEQGFVVGGDVYGYQRVREGSHVKRIINEAEAAIVRRIFKMIADGLGLLRIARTLNDEGVPSPSGRRWAATSIKASCTGTSTGAASSTVRPDASTGAARWSRTSGREPWTGCWPDGPRAPRIVKMEDQQSTVLVSDRWTTL